MTKVVLCALSALMLPDGNVNQKTLATVKAEEQAGRGLIILANTYLDVVDDIVPWCKQNNVPGAQVLGGIIGDADYAPAIVSLYEALKEQGATIVSAIDTHKEALDALEVLGVEVTLSTEPFPDFSVIMPVAAGTVTLH